MTVLALDLGTATGWAVSGGPSGVQSFATADSVSDEVRHGRLGWRFGGWLGDMLLTYRPAVVAIERMVGTRLQGQAARVLLGMRMVALATCRAHDIATVEVSSKEWQAWAKRAGYPWVKGNEQDALALLAYFEAERLPELGLAA